MKAASRFLPLAIILLSSFLPAPSGDGNITEVKRDVLLKMVNDVRQKGCRCGDTYYYPVAPVKWNDKLEKAAFIHSRDMAEKKYFSHTAPDGSRAGDRLKKAGYRWMAYGENIGKGFRNEKEMVEGWLRSPGHCKNIMGRHFKEMGVARYGNYWTQEFAAQ